MRYWLRLFAVFLITTPLSAMLAEPFFDAVLEQFGVNTETWAAPVVIAMFDVFASEWFRYLAFAAMGVGVGLLLNWLARSFDGSRKLNVTYSIRCKSESAGRLWYIVFCNDDADATFGAILELNGFSGWQNAPIGTVQATWRLNQDAVPWRQIANGEAVPLLIFHDGCQQWVPFYQDDAFALVMNDTGQPRRDGTVVVTFVCRERPEWRKSVTMRVDEGGLTVISSELQQRQ